MGFKKSVAHRLLSNVTYTYSGCWEWSGSVDNHGYGQMCANGKHARTHVLSFVVHKSQPTGGLCVMHTCDNRRCLNPEHLTLGTRQRNLEDMRQKGRGLKGRMHSMAKLSDEAVLAIRASERTNKDLARTYDVDPSVISRVRNLEAWKHVVQ
jgi:hypothetical protein